MLENGYTTQARDVLRRFGVTVAERPAGRNGRLRNRQPRRQLAGVSCGTPYTAITPVLVLYGLAWGLVNFGFLVWIPTYAAKSG